MDLAGVAIKLYELTPAEFTSERNARAKDLVASKDADLAAKVRSLPKPSASAWVVNQLADDALREQFGKLGGELRDAQGRADRESLTSLLSQRKALLKRIRSLATALAHDGGVTLSAAALAEVEQTFQAALADEGAFGSAFSRRLVRPIQSDGLEPTDLAGAVGGPEPPVKIPRRRPAPQHRTSVPKTSNIAAIKQAERKAQKADEALRTIEARLTAAHEERDQIEQDRVELQHQLDDLRERATGAKSLTKRLEKNRNEKRTAAMTAHRAVDAAKRNG
jgi:hypothetical protein